MVSAIFFLCLYLSMKRFVVHWLFLFLLLGSHSAISQKNYAALVNPFIGTSAHGHTYPGSSSPFGMVQLSPDTRLSGWDGCSGYHYTDSAIYGFSHKHLSGTGIADYCDILFMPFSRKTEWKNEQYKSSFSHDNEYAHAGYYSVLLDKDQIKAELTTTPRTGIHRYTYQKGKASRILIDLAHRDEVLESYIEKINEYEFKGLRRSRGWSQDQVEYFYVRFNLPVKSFVTAIDDKETALNKTSGKNIKAVLDFGITNKPVVGKVGISAVSEEGAKLNLDAEAGNKTFERLKLEAEAAWNKELSKIEVEGSKNEEQIFYTSLYHCLLSPNIYQDVDGSFRGMDKKIHKDTSFNNYTVFSLWDTYRAEHPLLNIIDQKRSLDFIKTFLAHYKYGGMMPVWELSAHESYVMIGYHSIPVILDALAKGINRFDAEQALKAITEYAESNRFGLAYYRTKGFISNDDEHESVSKTIEYAYDDWCIAMLAQKLGNQQIADRYFKRSLSYRNVFDRSVGFSRGKVGNAWYQNFDPAEVNNFFTEGNSWQYSFSAPHDVKGLIEMYGGKERFSERLNEMFTTSSKLSGRKQVDVTGLIGQYAHGNEPSHHIAYLFNYVGLPWRTQELVHRICKEFYTNMPDGLIGNEDCGQMSAWYVMSALGFYQSCPGSNMFEVGTPLFKKAKIHLENGKAITINAPAADSKHFYVKGFKLNGKSTNSSWFTYDDIKNGGEIEFALDSVAGKAFGIAERDWPVTETVAGDFVLAPFVEADSLRFFDSASVQLRSFEDAEIFYRQKGMKDFARYISPIHLSSNDSLVFFARKGPHRSAFLSHQFIKLPKDRKVIAMDAINTMYKADSANTLFDGVLGNKQWRNGEWISYYAKDATIVVDLFRERKIKFAGVHCLQDVGPWIIYPAAIEVYASDNNNDFKIVKLIKNSFDNKREGVFLQTLGANLDIKARYLKFVIKNGGKLPAWHESAGNDSHLFIDELIIEAEPL